MLEAVRQMPDNLMVDLDVPGRPGFMPLFGLLRPGTELDAALQSDIRLRIGAGASPRFATDAGAAVAEIPRTLTGKNKDACASPAAFDGLVEHACQRALQEQT